MNFLDNLNLRPGEKRLVVLVAVVLFIVLNWLFVWPKFNDWERSKRELEKARTALNTAKAEIAKIDQYRATKERLEGQGSSLMPQEAALQLRRTIENQVAQSGVILNGITDLAAKENPDQFFAERSVSMGFVSTPDDALVDFLFNIGERSMVRVRDLTVWPDQTLQKLQGNLSLTVSYQKRTTPTAAPASSTPSKPAPATSSTNTNTAAKTATNSTEKTGLKPVPSRGKATTPEPAQGEKKEPAKR